MAKPSEILLKVQDEEHIIVFKVAVTQELIQKAIQLRTDTYKLWGFYNHPENVHSDHDPFDDHPSTEIIVAIEEKTDRICGTLRVLCGDPKTEVNPVRNFLVFDTPPELEGVPGTQTAYIDKFVVSEFGTRSVIPLGLLTAASKLLMRLEMKYCFVLIHEQSWLAKYFPLQTVQNAQMVHLGDKISYGIYDSDLSWCLFYMEVSDFIGFSMKNTRRASVVSFELPPTSPLQRRRSIEKPSDLPMHKLGLEDNSNGSRQPKEDGCTDEITIPNIM